MEIVTILINGPGFDPLFRDDVIDIPLNHPDHGWGCLVTACQRPADASEFCHQHRCEAAAEYQGFKDDAPGSPLSAVCW